MAINWTAALFDPIYAALGVPATLTPQVTGTPITVTVIDDTAGAVITEGKLGIQTIRPVASVRGSELVANGLAPQDLAGASGRLVLRPGEAGEATWRIESFAIKPSPSGELAGEVQIILIKP